MYSLLETKMLLFNIATSAFELSMRKILRRKVRKATFEKRLCNQALVLVPTTMIPLSSMGVVRTCFFCYSIVRISGTVARLSNLCEPDIQI